MADRLADAQLPWRELDDDTRQLLEEGDTTGRYSSRSEVAMSLALRFRNQGRTLDEYLDAMTDSSNAASRWYRDLRDGRPERPGQRRKSGRGRDKALAELERCWHKAGQRPPPRQPDMSDVHERCEAVWEHALEALEGRTRATRLKVLSAVLDMARQHRTTRVIAAERPVAEAAGVHRHTARAALNDLVAAGCLGPASRADRGARRFDVPAVGSVRTYTSGSHAVERGTTGISTHGAGVAS